jgi:hypothetical protein
VEAPTPSWSSLSPEQRIARLTGKNAAGFIRDFGLFVGRVVSATAIATWLEILAERGMPLTNANLAAIREEETQRVADSAAARLARRTNAPQERGAGKVVPSTTSKASKARTRPKPAKKGKKATKKKKRKSSSVYTVSLNDTAGIAMVSASRRKRGGGWHR